MLRQEKEQVVKELAERLRATQTLIVTDYRGLSVTEIDDLRTKLLEAGARFTVIKNTLTKLAAEEAGESSLVELIDGPTAIAFLDAEADPAAAAKVLYDTARIGRILVVRGGLLDGNSITESDVERLAKLPPTDVLHGQLAGALAGPLTTVVGLFTAPLRDLVNVLDARIKQLEDQGEAAEEPVAEAEAEESAAEADASAAGEEAEGGAEPEEQPAEEAHEPEPESEEPQAEQESEEPKAEEEEQ
jgi:large subunit ribosomal protein L10